ncbi:Mitochondrial carrier protein [Balamuthia mandrillaris]
MTREPARVPLKETVLASTFAGVLSRVPCHPLDTCKAKLQVERGSIAAGTSSFREVVVRTWRQDGLKGFYRGFGITFLGSAPAGCLYFTSYELSKNVLTTSASSLPFPSSSASFLIHFTSGLVAEAVSCILWVPIDIIKQRLQVQISSPTSSSSSSASASSTYHSRNYGYKNGFHALKTIVQREGVLGLYRGYGATLLTFGPYSALYFLFYERFKSLASSFSSSSYPSTAASFATTTLSLGWIVACAGGAGALASLCTNPLDVAKLRLQVEESKKEGKGGEYVTRNVMQGVRLLWKEEGVRGLFRGAQARMAFQAPASTISLVAYEQFKKFFFAASSS